MCLSSLDCMAGVIFVYADTVFGFNGYSSFLCLPGCFSMITRTPAVLSVLYACVLYSCICMQLSMIHMERCSRNTLIIIIYSPGYIDGMDKCRHTWHILWTSATPIILESATIWCTSADQPTCMDIIQYYRYSNGTLMPWPSLLLHMICFIHSFQFEISFNLVLKSWAACMCASFSALWVLCVHACVRACVHACVCVCEITTCTE